MAYLALYRRYRPAGFDSIIGQDHIVKVLKAQIENGSIGHAYLFCGARGTGKTSAAKIFARAINCESPLNGSPCGKCETCGALEDSANMDILEIDAASNNKVEEVRDIREKVQYPPVSGKFKVYIIDEVHMLTDSAFNALLKTLEEPPRHAVFILATTEVYKLPATILSRCMRFDFRLVPLNTIAERIKFILNDIKKPFEEAAVTEIARAGEGSVRDALSILDMCVSYSKGALKYDDVNMLLSASDKGRIAGFGDSILCADIGGVLEEIEELSSAGKSITVLNKDIITYLRDLTVIKSCGSAREILSYPDDIYKRYEKSAKSADINNILRCIEIFSAIETEMKYSLHPRIIFEAAAVKAANYKFDDSPQALVLRIKELEKTVKELSSGNFVKTNNNEIINAVQENVKPKPEEILTEPLPEPPPEYGGEAMFFGGETAEPAKKAEQEEYKPDYKEEQPPEKNTYKAGETQSGGNAAENAGAIWGNVIRKLRQGNTGLLYTLCSELTAQIKGNDFIIITGNDMGAEILNKPKNYNTLKSIINSEKEYNVIVRKGAAEDNTEGEIRILNELAEGKLIIKD